MLTWNIVHSFIDSLTLRSCTCECNVFSQRINVLLYTNGQFIYTKLKTKYVSFGIHVFVIIIIFEGNGALPMIKIFLCIVFLTLNISLVTLVLHQSWASGDEFVGQILSITFVFPMNTIDLGAVFDLLCSNAKNMDENKTSKNDKMFICVW